MTPIYLKSSEQINLSPEHIQFLLKDFYQLLQQQTNKQFKSCWPRSFSLSGPTLPLQYGRENHFSYLWLVHGHHSVGNSLFYWQMPFLSVHIPFEHAIPSVHASSHHLSHLHGSTSSVSKQMAQAWPIMKPLLPSKKSQFSDPAQTFQRDLCWNYQEKHTHHRSYICKIHKSLKLSGAKHRVKLRIFISYIIP